MRKTGKERGWGRTRPRERQYEEEGKTLGPEIPEEDLDQCEVHHQSSSGDAVPVRCTSSTRCTPVDHVEDVAGEDEEGVEDVEDAEGGERASWAHQSARDWGEKRRRAEVGSAALGTVLGTVLVPDTESLGLLAFPAPPVDVETDVVVDKLLVPEPEPELELEPESEPELELEPESEAELEFEPGVVSGVESWIGSWTGAEHGEE